MLVPIVHPVPPGCGFGSHISVVARLALCAWALFAALPSAAVVEKFGAGHVVGFTPFAEQAAIGQLATDAGVGWTKEDLSWRLIETSPSNYNWINFDRFIDSAKVAGLNIVLNIAYTPSFYSSNPGAANYHIYPTTTADGLNAWSAFVAAAVDRYKNDVSHWQIWPNVDDYEFWGFDANNPGVAEYLALLQRAHAAIKAADPLATVILAAADPAFLNALLDQGGLAYFDAIAIHNYANATTPPAFDSSAMPEVSALTTLRLAAVRDVRNRRAPDKTLWTTEYGWPSSTASIGVDADTQKAYLVRSLLMQGAFREVDGVIWTDFQDQAVGGVYTLADPSDNYGMLLDIDMNPKPAYVGYQAMVDGLGGARYLRTTYPGTNGSTVVENFEASPAYEVFLGGGATGSYSLSTATPHAGSKAARIDYTLTEQAGSAVVIAPNPPNLYLPVSGTPSRLFVWARGDGGPAAKLAVEIEDASGEIFSSALGMVEGDEWKEYVYYIDAPPGSSSLLTGGGGNNDRIVDYPIRFKTFSIRGWVVSSPVTVGTIWLDDLRFDSGPSVIDYIFATPTQNIHALWALSGSPVVAIPAATPNAIWRDHMNSVSILPAAGGNVMVTTGMHPGYLTLPTNADTVGVFRPSNGALYLKNSNSSGFANHVLNYGRAGDVPIAGDWDGDGLAGIGVYRGGTFYLRNNARTNGIADITFAFGTATDLPVVGDWDGDGIDTVGIYRNGLFILRNSNSSGPADMTFSLGKAGDLPIAGDWNGDGVDTVGVFRPTNGALYLKNTNASGFADIMLTYGRAGDKPVTGDWDGNGTDTIGVYRNGTFYLRNSNTNGFADITFALGKNGDLPIAGDWDGLP